MLLEKNQDTRGNVRAECLVRYQGTSASRVHAGNDSDIHGESRRLNLTLKGGSEMKLCAC